MSNYRITENLEKEEIRTPSRVAKKIELYKNAGNDIGGDRKYEVTYNWTTEDFHLKLFEDKLRLASKPGSLKYMITAIYRVLHGNQEFYMVNKTSTFKNKNDGLEILSEEGIGHFLAPIIGMRYSEQKGALPEIVKFEHHFDQPWNPKEVKSLLSKSSVPCQNLYVGISNPLVSSEPVAICYKIENMEDFLTGSHTDLMDLSKCGLSMDSREASLYMLPGTRKRIKENKEKNAGLRGERYIQ